MFSSLTCWTKGKVWSSKQAAAGVSA